MLKLALRAALEHFDIFAGEVDVGVRSLLEVIEVESHFHEAVVKFTRVEIDVEGVLDRLFLDKTLTSEGLFFCEDLVIFVGSGEKAKHSFNMVLT